jgi:hypothetical protein
MNIRTAFARSAIAAAVLVALPSCAQMRGRETAAVRTPAQARADVLAAAKTDCPRSMALAAITDRKIQTAHFGQSDMSSSPEAAEFHTMCPSLFGSATKQAQNMVSTACNYSAQLDGPDGLQKVVLGRERALGEIAMSRGELQRRIAECRAKADVRFAPRLEGAQRYVDWAAEMATDVVNVRAAQRTTAPGGRGG